MRLLSTPTVALLAVVCLFTTGCDAADPMLGDAVPISGETNLTVAPAPIPLPHIQNYALWFGPGGSAFEDSFAVIQDQTVRIALDLRPDDLRRPHVVLQSDAGLLLGIGADGRVRFEMPGYGSLGEPVVYTVESGPGAVRAGGWQRVEATYDELFLEIHVDGVTVASTFDYHDRSPAPAGAVAFAPSFRGAVDNPAFTSFDGEVYEAADFDEGAGHTAYFTGLSGGERTLSEARWVRRLPELPSRP